MPATIQQLEEELLGLVKPLPAFQNVGFSVFDLNDFDSKRSGQTLPVVGVAFNGAEPQSKQSKDGRPVADVNATSLILVEFVIVIAVQYSYTSQDDTKPTAFNLLDAIRSAVNGFKGVNNRPWVWVGERPEGDASGDGTVFYSQIWQTTLPTVGNFNNL